MKKVVSVLAIAALSACTQIDTGNVGVESSMGQFKKEVLTPGVYFTLFKRVNEVSAKEILLPMENMRPQTKDKITLTDLDVDLYVQIDPSKATEILTRWPGDIVGSGANDGSVGIGLNYVSRIAREAIYSDIAERSSTTVHTERTEIAANVIKKVQEDLDKSVGKNWFFVRSANIRNIVTDPALEANIKAAASARFEIQKKEQDVLVAEAEAKRKRIEAQGEADAIRIKASAVAAQGGDDYVRLEAIKKWDGKLPTTTGAGAVPFVNVK